MKNHNKKYSVVVLLLCCSISLWSYPVQYAEQFYRLYHLHFYQDSDQTMENISYLEGALKAPFANPLYAMAPIQDKVEWEKYRYLFYMHVNLKLVELHLKLGSGWDKKKSYFYNAPWRQRNIDSLETAIGIYKKSYHYWEQAKMWSEKASAKKFNWLYLTDLQAWEDELFRIQNKELDYAKIIDRIIAHSEKVQAEYQAMDENTY